MTPGAVSREQHSELVDGSDSRESSLAVGVPCSVVPQVSTGRDPGLLYFGVTCEQFDHAWGCALADTSAQFCSEPADMTGPLGSAHFAISGHSMHSNGLQAESALPMFGQAIAGDDRAPAEDEWFLDSGAKRHYVISGGPEFQTLPLQHRPRIGSAGSAVLHYGVAIGDIMPQTATRMQLPLHAAMHTPGLTHNLVSHGVLCDST